MWHLPFSSILINALSQLDQWSLILNIKLTRIPLWFLLFNHIFELSNNFGLRSEEFFKSILLLLLFNFQICFNQCLLLNIIHLFYIFRLHNLTWQRLSSSLHMSGHWWILSCSKVFAQITLIITEEWLHKCWFLGLLTFYNIDLWWSVSHRCFSIRDRLAFNGSFHVRALLHGVIVV